MAAAVVEAARRWPDRLLVVVVGQTHLLGRGDLVGRSRLGGVVVGGQPPAGLVGAVDPTDRGACWRTEASVMWFAEMLGAAGGISR